MNTLMHRIHKRALLLLIAVAFSTFGIISVPSAQAATSTEVEQQFFDLINSARRLKGLAPLSNDGLLAQTSRSWSQSMAGANRLSHDPNLGGAATFVDPTWVRVGENVGFGGSVDQLWPIFMGSSPHKANILGDYNKVGIGVVIDSSGRVWVTQRFLKGAALPPPPGPPPPPGIVGNTGYVPLPPSRILDTRDGTGTGGMKEKFGPGGVLDLAVLGVGGVPAAGVTAVVVNVTVVSPSTTSFLTLYPRGLSPRPVTSNLNFVAGQTVADLVVARVGSGGKVSVFNNSGPVDVVGDVVGYYNDGTSGGGRYTTTAPTRLLDTRTGNGSPQTKLGAGAKIDVQMTGRLPLPSTGVTAVALNVTAVNATASSHLTVWPTDVVRPTASNLNFKAFQTVPNMVIAKVSADGRISVFNNAGQTDVLADVVGYFHDDTQPASTFTALNPARILDTRTGIGSTGKIGAGQTRAVQVRNRGGVPAGATSVIMTVTATNPSAPSHLTVFPSDIAQPDVSNLNFVTGQTVPNLVIAGIGADGNVKIFNNAGSVDVLADVVGYMS